MKLGLNLGLKKRVSNSRVMPNKSISKIELSNKAIPKKEMSKKEKIMNYLKLKVFMNYINSKIIQKNNNNYSPDNNGKKYIMIMACHCDSELKLNTISNNIKYFSFENVDKIIINSQGLSLSSKVEEICQKNNTKYYEIPNTSYYDYGKWIYAIKELFNYEDYDYIVLTNDSYIINNPINHFLNLVAKYNTDLFGYNDSTQNRYHYQSYLFSLKKNAIPLFINTVSNPNININSQNDVISNFELQMTEWFENKKSFLNIGNIFLHRGLNIFYTNDKLYIPLIKSGLLPFAKIKRIN